MAVTLILGESGTGKSTSLRNMNPDTTFIFQSIKKPLPFKGNKYTKENLMVTDNYETIIKGLLKLDKQDKFTDVILDDSQYIMANEFMRRSKEKGPTEQTNGPWGLREQSYLNAIRDCRTRKP